MRDIHEHLASGALKPGDRLPSEADLKRKYGISVNSIRRGVGLLVRQGLLERRQGSGTYVRSGADRPAEDAVRADAILLAVAVEFPRTHPYFGERDHALKARLSDLGWKVEPFIKTPSAEAEQHTVWHTVDVPRLVRQLEADRRIAGAVVDGRYDEAMMALGRRIPCVAVWSAEHCPFVRYCWEDETARAIRLAAEAGARRIRVFSSFDDKEFGGLAAYAAARSPGASPSLDIRQVCVPSNPSSRIMYECHEAARRMLREEGDPIDGIVMGSDFHAQGVLDALAEAPKAVVEKIRLVALTNKESRIHTALPFAALVADGAAVGTALADLLHQYIVSPDAPPASVFLRSSVRLPAGWPTTLWPAL